MAKWNNVFKGYFGLLLRSEWWRRVCAAVSQKPDFEFLRESFCQHITRAPITRKMKKTERRSRRRGKRQYQLPPIREREQENEMKAGWWLRFCLIISIENIELWLIQSKHHPDCASRIARIGKLPQAVGVNRVLRKQVSQLRPKKQHKNLVRKNWDLINYVQWAKNTHAWPRTLPVICIVSEIQDVLKTDGQMIG